MASSSNLRLVAFGHSASDTGFLNGDLEARKGDVVFVLERRGRTLANGWWRCRLGDKVCSQRSTGRDTRRRREPATSTE